MAGRKKGAKNVATLDYCMTYDSLVAIYGCPVEALFKMALGRYKPEIRLRAASALVNKRYPQQIAVKPSDEGQTELTFTWSNSEPDIADHDSIQASATRISATRVN